MNHEIENHHIGYRPMLADRPADPWDTSAAARADLMRRAARLAEREREDAAAVTSWSGVCHRCGFTWPPTPRWNMCPECKAGPLSWLPDGRWAIDLVEYPAALMPDDEQEDAEPSYPPRTGGGACAGGLFAALVLAFAACAAWALVGPWLSRGGR